MVGMRLFSRTAAIKREDALVTATISIKKPAQSFLCANSDKEQLMLWSRISDLNRKLIAYKAITLPLS